MSKQNENFLEGLRDGLPICLGYLSVSFAFGISAVGMGLSCLEAVLISMFNLTSAGQLAGAPIIASFGSLYELALAQLIINLRYSLMSISLSQKFGSSVRMRDRFWIAFCTTDEIFAVASGKKDSVGRRYMAGLCLTPPIGWTLGTLFGAILGNVLPEGISSALGLAIYGMFVAIVLPPCKKSTSTLMAVLVSAALSCAIFYIPAFDFISSGFSVILCAVVSSVIFALLFPVKSEEEKEVNNGTLS